MLSGAAAAQAGAGFGTVNKNEGEPVRIRSLASTAALAIVAAGVTAFQQPALAAGGATLYVDRGAATCTDSGTGTQAAPYCTIQAAANAATAGDTVLISGDDWGYANYGENVVISNSGTASAPITFKAEQETFRIYGNNTSLQLTGSYIQVEGASVSSVGSNPPIIVSGANDVIDESSAEGDGSTVVQFTGTATNDTVERSAFTSRNVGHAIQIDSQARNITVSTNRLTAFMPGAALFAATGTTGLNVTGNSFSSDCGSAIALSGVTQASVENNIAVQSTFCSSYSADLVVDAASTASTTVGYNIFTTAISNAYPYSWGGTLYPSQATFQTATGQGTADIDPPTFDLSPSVLSDDNPAIDSANSDAPGELATDISGASRTDDPSVPNTGSGTYSYYDRGAVEYQEFSAAGVTAYDYFDEPQRVTVGLDLHGFTWGQSAMYTVSWGDGTTPSSESANGSNTFEYNHMYASRGTYTITETVTDDAQTVTKTLTVTTHGSDYVPVSPTRVLDTRNGTGAPQARVAAGGTLAVDVTSGVIGAPAADTITAVVLNALVVNPAGGGYLTAYPDGMSRPKSSNLDFSAGQTVPNLVTVKVRNGKIDLYNGSGGTTDLVADVQGYYVDAAGSGYVPMAPTRLLDTRKGIGAPARAVAPGGTVALKVEGVSGIPASGVSAVAVNVTVTAPTGGGYITVYPDGTTMPKASNLDFSAGQTVPNMVVVKVGGDGEIDLRNTSSGTVQLIADVAGYYSTTGGHALVPTDPRRLLDTRTGTGQESASPLPVAPESNAVWFVDGEVLGESALVLNVTVTNPKSGGYITAYPSTAPRPTASNLDFSAGQTVPNMVMVSAGNGTVDLFNASAGTTDLIADLFGYFS